MKKTIFLIIISVLFFGCPFESNFPISEPSIEFPSEMCGKWKKSNSTDDSYYHIEQFEDYRIEIKNRYASKEGDKTIYKNEYYTAWLSKIEDDFFLNVENTEMEYETYYLYKIELHQDKIILHPIDENHEIEIKDSESLQEWIKENKDHDNFYSYSEVYNRIN